MKYNYFFIDDDYRFTMWDYHWMIHSSSPIKFFVFFFFCRRDDDVLFVFFFLLLLLLLFLFFVSPFFDWVPAWARKLAAGCGGTTFVEDRSINSLRRRRRSRSSSCLLISNHGNTKILSLAVGALSSN